MGGGGWVEFWQGTNIYTCTGKKKKGILSVWLQDLYVQKMKTQSMKYKLQQEKILGKFGKYVYNQTPHLK
jgi:hypothetical protein